MSMTDRDGKVVPTADQLQAQAAFTPQNYQHNLQQQQQQQSPQWPPRQPPPHAVVTAPFVPPGSTYHDLMHARNQSMILQQSAMRQQMLQQQQQQSVANERIQVMMQQRQEAQEQIDRQALQENVIQTSFVQAGTTNKEQQVQVYPQKMPGGNLRIVSRTHDAAFVARAAPESRPAAAHERVTVLEKETTLLQKAAVNNFVDEKAGAPNDATTKPPSTSAATAATTTPSQSLSENQPSAVPNQAAAAPLSEKPESSIRKYSPNTTGDVTTGESKLIATAEQKKSVKDHAAVSPPDAATPPTIEMYAASDELARHGASGEAAAAATPPATLSEEQRSFSPDTQADFEAQAKVNYGAVSTSDASVPQSVTTVSVKEAPVAVTTAISKPAVEVSAVPAAAVKDKQDDVATATISKRVTVIDLSGSPPAVKKKQVNTIPTDDPQRVLEPSITSTRTPPLKSAINDTKIIGLQVLSAKETALKKIAQADKKDATELVKTIIQKVQDTKQQEQAPATLKASNEKLKAFLVSKPSQHYQVTAPYQNRMSPLNTFVSANGRNTVTASTGPSHSTGSHLVRAQIAPRVELQSRKRKSAAGPRQARVSPEVELVQVTRPAPCQANGANFRAVSQVVPAPVRVRQMEPSGNAAVRRPTVNNFGYPNSTYAQYQYQQAQQYLHNQQQLRQQRQAMQAAVARNSRVEYDVAPVFVPLGPPPGNAHELSQSFHQLSSSSGCTLQAIGLYSLRPQNAVNVSRQSRLSKAMSTAYRSYLQIINRTKGTVPQNQTALVLSCSACFTSSASLGFCFAGSVYFPHDTATLNACLLAMKSHLKQCPNCHPEVRNAALGVTQVPGFRGTLRESAYIKQFCATYGMFQSTVNRPTRPKPLIDVNDVYNDNVDAIEDALKTTTMSLHGVVGQDVCDIVDSDLVYDDPFCIFVLERMSLVRIYKKCCPPEYRQLFESDSINEAENDIFLLRCRCCGARTKDGSFNPDATAILRDSKLCAVKMTSMIFTHFGKCFTGKQLQKFEMLKFDPVLEDPNFVKFAAALHKRIVSIIVWIRELYDEGLRVAAIPDQEMWRSVHGEQMRTLFASDDGIPISDLMGPKKAAGAPGSAVLECWGFPKVGLLHGEVGSPTRNDLKMSCPNKRARLEKARLEAKRSEAKHLGAKVMDLEILPSVELAKAQRYLQSGVIHVDNL